ncbi:MAG: YfhO family protein [bacterium]|nr:YfhO family protein [bacterium]
MLRKINHSLIVFASFCLFLFVVSFFIKDVYFPSDILYYFPIFSASHWQSPHNSLLADPVFQFEPWRHFMKEQILNGRLPLWNNLNGLGVPFLANPQTAIFFPLTAIYILFPLTQGLFLMYSLKVFLFAFFTYQLLRNFSLSKRSAFLGAFAASFSSFFVTWLHWPHTNVFLFLPIMLLLVERVRKAKNQIIWLILFSLSSALAFFGGHPETFFQITLVVAGFSAFRCLRNKKTLLLLGAYGFLGVALAGVQLIPFLEYLFLSSQLYLRSFYTISNSLPPVSSIQLLFPFVLGAPHQSYYKSFPTTNFQESAGGYVGLVLLFLALAAVVRLSKSTLIRFWTVIAVASVGLAYAIPPFSIISHLPIFDENVNQRFIAVFGYSVILMGSIMIDCILNDKNGRTKKLILVSTGISIACILISFFLPRLGILMNITAPQKFLILLRDHIILQLISSVLFLNTLLFMRRNKFIQFIFLCIFLFLQTGLLFWDYNPFTKKVDYYPEATLTKKLQSLPTGNILELGNPSLRAESNMIYHLPLLKGYDALGVRKYDLVLESAFPDRNFWGNPEDVSENALQALGVKYIVSDFDLRLIRQRVNHETTTLLPKLTKNHTFLVELTPQHTRVRGIRLLTANYNRANSCIVTLTILSEKSSLKSGTFPCANARDKMFYFLPISVDLDIHKKYLIELTSNGSESNSIALWGASTPYLDVFYENTKQSFLKPLSQEAGSYLFLYPKAEDIRYSGEYSFLYHTSGEVQIETASDKAEVMEIKMTNYPGWRVTIDGLPQRLEEDNVFLTFPVPSGNHLISARYLPKSFLIGILVSFASGLFLLLKLFRTIYRSSWWETKWKNLNVLAKRSGKIPFWEHAVVIFFGIWCAIITYLLFFSLYKIHFTMPETTSINWLTVHNYPRQQDYFYFSTAFAYILFIAIFIWILWLWKKSK